MIQRYESTIGDYELMEDGSLVVKNIKVMAVGQWHASNGSRPTRYGESVLAEYSDEWGDRSLWTKHSDDRSVTDKIGTVENTRFEENATMGDLHLHGLTDESKSAITLIKHKQITGVSSEVAILKSNYCEKQDIDNVKAIRYVGCALVETPACDVCVFEKNEEHQDNDRGDNMVEVEELTKKIEELEALVTDMSQKFEAIEIPEAVDMAPITEEVAELKKFEERIAKLEKTPVTVTLDNSAKDEEKKVYNPFE